MNLSAFILFNFYIYFEYTRLNDNSYAVLLIAHAALLRAHVINSYFLAISN